MTTQEFYCAYMNVGLHADDVWRYNTDPDTYEKTNENLWIRFNELNKFNNDMNAENISFKYLGQCFRKEDCYNFTYNTNDRKQDNASINHYVSSIGETVKDRDYEVWMLPEVEEEFKRLTCTVSSRWSHTSLQQLADEEVFLPISLKECTTQELLTSTPWPQTLLTHYPLLPYFLKDVTNLSVFSTKNFTDDENNVKKKNTNNKHYNHIRIPRFTTTGTEELHLKSIFMSQNLKDIWSSSTTEGGVQKFCLKNLHVKNNLKHHKPKLDPVIWHPLRCEFPSVCDLTYESDLFPYSVPTVSGFHEPAMFSVVSSAIPVYQRPPELYNSNVFRKRYTNAGADHSNLILLTSSDDDRKYDGLGVQPVSYVNMLRVNNHCDGIRTKRFSNIKSSTKEPYDEMLAQVNKWLDKVYPTRSTNFADITTVIETMDNLSKTFCSNLTLTVSSADQVKNQSDLQNKYDELEREALEQYTGSDTNLFLSNLSQSNVLSLQTDFAEQKFQDLEREALEQYEEINKNID